MGEGQADGWLGLGALTTKKFSSEKNRKLLILKQTEKGMIGVILCGGESTRMGTDKGLILREHKTWTELAIEKMQKLKIPVLVSVNAGQREAYEQVLGERIFITDDPTLGIRGPLTGLISIHLQYPTEDLFILACDLPDMETSILRDIYERYILDDHNGFPQVYLYTNDGEPEPLCSIYRAGALAAILKLQRENRLIKHSLKFMLQQLVIDSRAIPDHQKYAFRNANTPPDVIGNPLF
jgi:molybdopterin-guanine dinucleotide biosynthesis protein A